VLHQMLFMPFIEATRPADAPISSAEIYAYAERTGSFYSEHGVCAGPQAMIEEFLAVLIDGRQPADDLPGELDAEITHAIAEIEPALDYALLALQAHAATFSLWPAMTRAYEAIAEVTAAWAQTEAPQAARLNTRFQTHMETVRSATYMGEERWRSDREAVYADMYGQCARGMTGSVPNDPLTARLAPQRSGEAAAFSAQLRQALAPQFAGRAASASHLEAMVETIADYVLRTQMVLRLATEAQARVNQRLGRTPPSRPFSARDISLHSILQGLDVRRLPYLLDELETGLQVKFTIDGETLECVAQSMTSTHEDKNSEGIPPTV
jgi:hypothetical protein